VLHAVVERAGGEAEHAGSGEELEDGHRRLQEEKAAMRTETAKYWRAWRS
jgi:hypothetical protein